MALPSLKLAGGTDTEGSPLAATPTNGAIKDDVMAKAVGESVGDAMQESVGGAEPPAPTAGLEPSLEHLEQVVENTAQIKNFTRETPLMQKNTDSMIFRLYEIRDELRAHTEMWGTYLTGQQDQLDISEKQAEVEEDEKRDADRAGPLEDLPDAVPDEAGGGKIPKVKGMKKDGPLGKFMKMLKGLMGWFALAAVLIGGIFMSDGGGEFVQKLVDMFTTIWQSLKPLVTMIMETVLPPVLELFGRLADLFAEIVVMLMPVVMNLIEELWPVVMDVFNSVMDLFVKIVDFLMPVIKTIIGMIGAAADNLGGMVSTFVNLLGDLFTSPMLFLKNIPDTIISALANLINGFIGMVNKILPERWKLGEVKFGEAAEARMEARRAEYAQADAEAAAADVAEETGATVEEMVEEGVIKGADAPDADEIRKDGTGIPSPADDGTTVGQASAETASAQRAATTKGPVNVSSSTSNAPVSVSSTTSTQKINYGGNSLSDSNFGTAGAF